MQAAVLRQTLQFLDREDYGCSHFRFYFTFNFPTNGLFCLQILYFADNIFLDKKERFCDNFSDSQKFRVLRACLSPHCHDTTVLLNTRLNTTSVFQKVGQQQY